MDSRLVDASNSILSNLATALATEGVSVPGRQYIHSGDISHDFVGQSCTEAFIVAWQGTLQGQVDAAGQGGNVHIRCAMPLSAQFQVALLRCVPLYNGNQPPSVAKLTESAEEILTDAMTIPAVIVDLVTSNTLLGTPGGDQVSIASVLPIGPLGGVGGTVVTLFATLL